MSHFHEALHPDDLGPSHQGEWLPEDERDADEETDTAVTTWLGGRQPVLEPVEALLGEEK